MISVKGLYAFICCLLLGFLLLNFGFSPSAFAIYGARPMSMGGAFTAIADDSNAAYWNPAGFAINPGTEVSFNGLIDHRNESIGDNYAALKMGFETPLDSPFHWVLGVGAVAVAGAATAQYLSDQDVLKKNWGRSGQKTAKGESMADEVKAEDTGEQTSRNAIIGNGLDKIFGRKKTSGSNLPPASTEASPSIPTTSPGTNPPPPPANQNSPAQPVVVNNYYQNTYYQPAPTYFGPIPFFNPGYYADFSRPTYYEDREYSENPKNTPAGKAQFALGLTWMRDNNVTLDQNTNWYTLSLATAWEETIALGSNLNVYDLAIPSTNTRGFGAGLDFGFLIRSYEKLFIGACAQEVLTTDIHWTNGATTTYAMNVNLGAAARPMKEVTLSADIHNFLMQNNAPSTLHFGLEIIPLPGIALRAGLSDGNKTAGAGIKLGEILADYAILGGSFGRTQMASLAWKF